MCGLLSVVLGGGCDLSGPVAPTSEDQPTMEAASPSTALDAARASGPLPFYEDASFAPKWIEPGSSELERFHRIPPFALTNQDGQRVTEETFEGKIYIADFFFTTCPGICKSMTQNMAELQETFEGNEEVLFLSHSVTPDVDDVEQLHQYAKVHGARSGTWHMVTGERSEIYDLGRRSYFADEDEGGARTDDEFLHTENFVLVDRDRHVRGVYNGLNKASLRQLVADVRRLQRQG